MERRVGERRTKERKEAESRNDEVDHACILQRISAHKQNDGEYNCTIMQI